MRFTKLPRPSRRPSRPRQLVHGALRGAAAGAAGTTALNATTYLDMAVRGRPSSSTPEQTVEELTDTAGIRIPGEGEVRENRVAGLGPLQGVFAGVGTGALIGVVSAAGGPHGRLPLLAASTAGGLLAGNAPMTLLGITDPRQWSAKAWVSDIVPHVAYGAVTGVVLHRLLGRGR